jgi:hypothetical protein
MVGKALSALVAGSLLMASTAVVAQAPLAPATEQVSDDASAMRGNSKGVYALGIGFALAVIVLLIFVGGRDNDTDTGTPGSP